jgi:hypothetical protein
MEDLSPQEEAMGYHKPPIAKARKGGEEDHDH